MNIRYPCVLPYRRNLSRGLYYVFHNLTEFMNVYSRKLISQYRHEIPTRKLRNKYRKMLVQAQNCEIFSCEIFPLYGMGTCMYVCSYVWECPLLTNIVSVAPARKQVVQKIREEIRDKRYRSVVATVRSAR